MEGYQKFGALSARYDLPNLTEASQNLRALYLIHGRAGNANVIWFFRSLFGKEMPVVAFEAPKDEPILPASPSGKSWWTASEVNELGIRELKDPKLAELAQSSASVLRGAIDKFENSFNLSITLRIGLGFSQGAALLARFALDEPTFFDKLILICGFVPLFEGEKSDLIKSEKFNQKVFIYNGKRDQIIPFADAMDGFEVLRAKFPNAYLIVDEGAHKITSNGLAELKKWLS
ncbi:MAG TPA: hypothetical protein PKD37_06880 [Oligoflexia bacterium]|nr:hypothetical protein [Oligoflexia bacterium]HMP27687.1 hypothetical protein [Oligoflexia bacterium]